MLHLYNTLTKKKEKFVPINPGKVGMYVCGPTVYDYVHIGNLRAYTMPDILRRYLEYLGYEVRMIKNITDVGHLTEDYLLQGDTGEDKILKKALAEKKTPGEIADFYEEYFHSIENEMNILPAHYFPRATAHIPQMIRIIEGLAKKGYAYEKNGNVFFDVTKFPDYGKLSGNTLENLKVGARLEEHPDKKNPWDFALWLKAPKEHLLKWKSPWSLGYPGWHIECTAMSTEYLGDTFDIHTGAEDGIFPHHEAEIAQTECYTGTKFVNYWFHLRHLLVDGKKMSKSKKNFYKLEDIKEKGYSPMDLRMALVSSHYRSPMNFTWLVMEQAKSNLETLNNFYTRLIGHAALPSDKLSNLTTDSYREELEKAMNDDLNAPKALSVILRLANDANKLLDENLLGNPGAVKKFLEAALKIFGLKLEILEIPEQVKKLAEERKSARNEKDFKKSDELRAKIEKLGFTIEDLKDNNYLIKPARNASPSDEGGKK
ncbi:MAG TPA: cysteine--tRNA ligase [Patescibacteria group bacterium]